MHRREIYRVGIFLLFLLCAFPAAAQEKMSYADADQQTYALYLKKDWAGIDKAGHKALAEGIDFYYLRLRMGMAYYYRRNFFLAEHHLIHALGFSSGDPVSLELLYWCYVFEGKYEEARALSKSFTPELAKQIGSDTLHKLGFVMLEGGSKSSDSSRLYQSSYYFQAGLGHFVNNRFSLFHAATISNETDLVGGTTQLQYYLKASIPIKYTWNLMPAIQLITRNFTPTPGPPPPWHPTMGHPFPPPPPPRPLPIRSNYAVGSMMVRKTIGTFDIAIGTTISNIDSNGQINHSLALTWYPLGNTRLSASCTGYLYTSDKYQNSNTAFNPSITVCPWKRLAFTIAYLNCKGSNLVESDGYIVNNRPDPTRMRWSYLASLTLSKHVAIYGLYQIEDKQEYTKQFTYHYNLIVAGLKFNP
jgi:hypothetical protein